MSLVNCEECEYEVSEKAKVCMNCGHPQSKPAGVDEGLKLFYYGLSYRRKLIRTLWMLPLCAVVLLAPELRTWISPEGGTLLFFENTRYFWFSFLVLMSISQIGYNYVQWQNKEAV